MQSEGALAVISSQDALAQAVIPYLQDQDKAIEEGERVLAITLKHQGSLERQFSIVSHLL
jgi:3-deoxy-D-manno-octulosonic-acid transferase